MPWGIGEGKAILHYALASSGSEVLAASSLTIVCGEFENFWNLHFLMIWFYQTIMG